MARFLVVFFLSILLAPFSVKAQIEPPPVDEERERAATVIPADAAPAGETATSVLPVTNVATIAGILNIPAQDVVGISLRGSDMNGFGRGQSSLGYHFPIAGSEFLIISTGNATQADLVNNQTNLSTTLGGLSNQQGNDLVQLELKLSVPPGVNCATFDFAFYSEEFPEYVGSKYNDAFTAEFGGTNLSISNNAIVAPLNYAFDAEGHLITINTVSGVTAPTASVYDGKTPLRRAQKGVTPNQDVTIVLSVQDLGDSVFDSAVFVDNFFWSNNADCGGFVEPPPQPMGTLQLHMVSALPTGKLIKPRATVGNQSAAPTTYKLVLELRQGFGLLDSRQFDMLLQPKTSQQVEHSFGVRPPGNYVIRANLYQGTELLETTYQVVTVGGGYLQLQNQMDDLTKAAHEELNEGRELAVDVLERAVLETGKTVVSIAAGKVAKVFAEIKLEGDLAPNLVEDASEAFTEWLTDFGWVSEQSEAVVAPMWRNQLDIRSYNGRHEDVDEAKESLFFQAQNEPFTWLDSWSEDVVRYREVIKSRNEEGDVGFDVRFDTQYPFIRRSTLTEMVNDFFFFVDKVLPVVEAILMIALVIIIVAAIVAFIISTAGTGSGLLVAAAASIKAALPGAYGIFKVVGFSKELAAGVAILCSATLIGLTATLPTAGAVVGEHDKAMDDFADRISTNLNARLRPERLVATTRIDGYNLSVDIGQTTLAASGDAAPVYVQLFRADGQLLAFERFDDAAGALSWRLPPGPYWTVVTSRDARARSTVQQAVEVTAPAVDVNVIVGDPQLQPGETLTAQVTVKNTNTGQATGPLSLQLRTLPYEQFEIIEFQLAPNETKTFNYQVTPPQAGSYLFQAQLAQDEFALNAKETGVVVGTGPALSLNVNAGTTYSPGSDVAWNAVLANAGNQGKTSQIDVTTFERSIYALAYNESKTVSVGPGGQQTIPLNILPDAPPGNYMTMILVDGQVRDTLEFLVTADGALFVVTAASPQFADVGQAVTLDAYVQDEAYAAIDATLLGEIRKPDGSAAPFSFNHVGLGHYQATYTPTTTGTYSVLIAADKINYPQASADTYFVADMPSLLKGNTINQLVLDQTKPIELTVKNEIGGAVPGATVVLSSTLGVQTEVTNNVGQVTFVVQPSNETPVDVTIKKPGFASTKLTLPVAIQQDTTAPQATWFPPERTNDSTLAIEGHTEPGATISVQGKVVNAAGDGSFVANVQLNEGGNNLTAVVADPAGNQTTLTAAIVLDTVPPPLTVQWPAGDPDTWGPTEMVSGQTQPGVLVTVNEVSLSADGSGNFVAWIAVSGPDPVIVVRATDAAGNSSARSFGLESTLFLPVALRIPYVPPAKPLLNGDFEAGRTGWQEISAQGWQLIISRDQVPNMPTHSGLWAAWLGGDDDEIAFVIQEVTVPAGQPWLTYYHGIASEDACGHDFGGVIVNDVVVDQYNLCQNANTPNWVRHAVNLSAYAGQTVWLQIRAETNGSKNSNLLVDDVAFASSARAAGDAPLRPFVAPAGPRPSPLPTPPRDDAPRLFGW